MWPRRKQPQSRRGRAAQGDEEAAPRSPTVYSLRLATGVSRGSALSDPTAGVLVCLVGQDGSAVLHRVTPLSDPEAQAAEVAEICEVRAVGVGCIASRRDGAGAKHQVKGTEVLQTGPPPRCRLWAVALNSSMLHEPTPGRCCRRLLSQAGRG